MSGTTEALVVRKSLLVECPAEHAFETFTAAIDSWWPLHSHSIGDGRAVAAVFEPGLGGRLFERWDDGSEHSWGTVIVWEPPRRVAVSWKVNPDAAAPTEWAVTFVPEGDATRVELEHRGWERLGEPGRKSFDDYHRGWDIVLRRFPEAAARA